MLFASFCGPLQSGVQDSAFQQREHLLNTVVMMQDGENAVLILHTHEAEGEGRKILLLLSFSLAWKPSFYFYLFPSDAVNTC